MLVKKIALLSLVVALFAGFAAQAQAGGCSKSYGYGGSYYTPTYYKPAPRPVVVAKPAPPVAPPATIVPVGAVITLPGHGFGPQPGHVLLTLPGLQLHVPVGKWEPCAIQVQIPELALTCPTLAKLEICRADGFRIAPIHLKLTPAAVQGIVIGTPGAQPAAAAPVLPTGFNAQNNQNGQNGQNPLQRPEGQ